MVSSTHDTHRQSPRWFAWKASVKFTAWFVPLLACLVAAQIWRANYRKQERRQAIRAAQVNPATAIGLLEEIVRRDPNDAEVLMCLAKCREQVPERRLAHLSAAAQAYLAAGALLPGRKEPWLQLARLQSILGDHEASSRAARQALRVSPQDEDAILLLSNAAVRNCSVSELRTFLPYSDSDSWKLRLAAQNARIALGTSPAELLHAKGRTNHLPQAPADRLLEAMLLAQVGDRAAAIQKLELAFPKDPLDLEWTRTAIRLCSELNAWDTGVNYLETNSECLRDPYLSLWYARRLWERGRTESIVETLASEQRPFASHPEVNLLLCMALHHESRLEELQSLIYRLERESRSAEHCIHWLHLIQALVRNAAIEHKHLAELAQEVLEISPSCTVARLIHASCFYHQGEYRLTAKLTEEALGVAPNWLQLWQLRIVSLTLDGQMEKAAEVARQTVQSFPESLDAQIAAGLLHFASLKGAESVPVLTRLLDWTSNLRLPEQDDRVESVAFVRMLALSDLGEHERAQTVASEFSLLMEEPRRRDLICRLMMKNYFRIASRSQIPSLGPSRRAQSQTVVQVLKSTVQDRSAASIQRFKEQSPPGAIAWRLLEGHRLLKIRNPQNAAGAVQVLRPVLVTHPASPDANLLMGLAMLRLHDIPSGVEYWCRAIEASEESRAMARRCIRLSLTLRNDGDWADTAGLLKFWMNTASDFAREDSNATRAQHEKDALELLASHAEAMQDQELAEASYRMLLQRSPQQHSALNNLAFLVLRRGGDLGEAQDLVNQAIDFAPGETEYHDTLKQIQHALQRTSESVVSNP